MHWRSIYHSLVMLPAAASACGQVTEVDPDSGTAEVRELTIVTDVLPRGNREVPYDAELEAAGGSPPYSWQGAALPPGLSLSNAGAIEGTPSEDGNYNLAATVTDAEGRSSTATLAILIENQPVITTDALPPLHIFHRYETQLDAVGGNPPYNFDATGLPPGLTVAPETGILTNEADAPAITDASPTDVTITVTDSAGNSDAKSLPLEIIAIETLAAGLFHTCALDVRHDTWCWGSNSSGTLGNGDEQLEESAIPVRAAEDHEFVEITGGHNHTCARTEGGVAWCWGDNSSGQLGNGDAEGQSSAIPARVTGDLTFSSIAAGDSHTCALDENGNAWCWGSNSAGQLGNNEDENSPQPVEVSQSSTYTTIVAGASFSCALDTENSAWCWGSNSSGALGDDNLGDNSSIPVAVVGEHSFTSLAAGGGQSGDTACALDDTAAAWCWGNNESSQLGHATELQGSAVPGAVEDNHTFASISVGGPVSCARDTNSTAWCWGSNSSGQLGSGEEGPNSVPPLEVEGDITASSLSAGYGHTCVLNDSGTVFCWGRNRFGQLGNNDEARADSPSPVAVHPGS